MSEHKFDFTYDWISGYHSLWDKLLPREGIRNIFEIGCFEGRSSVWFLQRYPQAFLTAVDTFEGGPDHKELRLDFNHTKRRFLHNTSPWSNHVNLYEDQSDSYLDLARIHNRGRRFFDIILIDGDHTAPGVLSDIMLSWPLLSAGGYLILDDYGWGQDRPPNQTPRPAIDAFLSIYEGQYDLLYKDYQVILRKL